MTRIFEGIDPVSEAANAAFSALFEGGGGMVKHAIDRARDFLISSRGMDKESAEDAVRATRNIFFDGFAAPGENPVTDRNFKRMMPLFRTMAAFMVDTLGYGTPGFDRTRAMEYGVAFRKFMEGPGGREALSGKPVDWEKVLSSADPGYESPSEWSYVEVDSYDALKMYEGQYGLQDWCIVKDRSDWDSHTMEGTCRFFLFMKDGGNSADDVVGVIVGPYGKVQCAYNRGDRQVSAEKMQGLVDAFGLGTPVATASNALDLLNGHDGMPECDGMEVTPGNVFRSCEGISGDTWLVTTFGKRLSGIIREDGGKYSLVAGWYATLEPYDLGEGVFVADGKTIVKPADGLEKYIPEGFGIAGGYLDGRGEAAVPLRKSGGGPAVNALCLEPGTGTMLDPSNGIAVESVACMADPDTDARTTFNLDDGRYLVVGTPDGHYVVDRAGKKLEECPFCPDGEGMTLMSVSREGACVMRRGDRYELMKDGKFLVEGRFSAIEWPGKGDTSFVFLEDGDTGKWYRYYFAERKMVEDGNANALTEGVVGDFARKVAKGTVMAAMCLGMLSHADAAPKKAVPGVQTKAAPVATVKKDVQKKNGVTVTKAQLQNIYASDAYNDRVTELLKELVKNNPGSNEQRLYNKACMRAMQEIVDGKLKLN